ncbi:MAG: hypothetical protein ABJF04_06250 [Reichenbachiella sp.]|uniref:hypothetical protein n=1 Tax=Reichenbachiella sp. TaxID=2184521 RepID=UPI003265A57C
MTIKKKEEIKLLHRLSTIWSSTSIASLVGAATIFANLEGKLWLVILGMFLMISFILSLLHFTKTTTKLTHIIDNLKE